MGIFPLRETPVPSLAARYDLDIRVTQRLWLTAWGLGHVLCATAALPTFEGPR